MAQAEKDLGSVRGPQGAAGKDAKVATATGTVTGGHKDSPTVTIEVGGTAGAQTFDFTFDGIAGATGAKGDAGTPGTAGAAGPAGKDAKITAVTVTSDGTHLAQPTCEASVSGDAGDQTITLAFTGLAGATGPAGPAGPAGAAGAAAKFTGTSSQITLGDGTPQDISTFITTNIEAIRTALGLATTSKNGLVPKLPA